MSTPLQLRQAMKQSRLRMTPQRQLVVDIVAEMRGHIAAEMVHKQVVECFPSVHMSTVYRTLQLLEELGYLRHTPFTPRASAISERMRRLTSTCSV